MSYEIAAVQYDGTNGDEVSALFHGRAWQPFGTIGMRMDNFVLCPDDYLVQGIEGYWVCHGPTFGEFYEAVQ